MTFSVLAKLILFSLLMLVVPLSIFYASFKFFFHGRVSPSPILGPSTVFSSALELGNIVYSTVLAIVAVNTILFGYVLVAILEKEDGDEAGIRKKKA